MVSLRGSAPDPTITSSLCFGQAWIRAIQFSIFPSLPRVFDSFPARGEGWDREGEARLGHSAGLHPHPRPPPSRGREKTDRHGSRKLNGPELGCSPISPFMIEYPHFGLNEECRVLARSGVGCVFQCHDGQTAQMDLWAQISQCVKESGFLPGCTREDSNTYCSLSRMSSGTGKGYRGIVFMACSATREPTPIRARRFMIGANITRSAVSCWM
jgi:hypothetical protein